MKSPAPSMSSGLDDLGIEEPSAIEPLNASSAGEIPAEGVENMAPAAPQDLLAEEPVAAEGFVSKRDRLGEPRSIVPDLDQTSAHGSRVSAPVRNAGGFSWGLAGAFLLGSLGLIGYMHRSRSDNASPRGGGLRPGGSWLPPRGRNYAPLAVSHSSAGNYHPRPSELAGLEPVWRGVVDFSEGSAPRRAREAAPRSLPRRSALREEFPLDELVGSRRPEEQMASPRREGRFHDFVEKSVRRKKSRSGKSVLRIPGRKTGGKNEVYDRVTELADEGFSAREIAGELNLASGTVEAILRLRVNSATRADSRSHAMYGESADQ